MISKLGDKILELNTFFTEWKGVGYQIQKDRTQVTYLDGEVISLGTGDKRFYIRYDAYPETTYSSQGKLTAKGDCWLATSQYTLVAELKGADPDKLEKRLVFQIAGNGGKVVNSSSNKGRIFNSETGKPLSTLSKIPTLVTVTFKYSYPVEVNQCIEDDPICKTC